MGFFVFNKQSKSGLFLLNLIKDMGYGRIFCFGIFLSGAGRMGGLVVTCVAGVFWFDFGFFFFSD